MRREFVPQESLPGRLAAFDTVSSVNGSSGRNGAHSAEKPADRAFTIWLTGLPSSGKSTLAEHLERRFRAVGSKVEVLDADVVRSHLSRDLGFSKKDRDENVFRIGVVCELLSRNGVVAIAAAVSPYRAAREEQRRRIPDFVEVHVDCSLDVLIERDPKGLYRRALAGEIANFTGISDPYEPPLHPEVRIDSAAETPEQSLEKIWSKLEELKLVPCDGSRCELVAE